MLRRVVEFLSKKDRFVFWFWIIARIFLLLVALHFFNEFKNTYITFSHLKKYPYVPYTNSYEIAAPLHFFTTKKQEKAVLLLHGFSASPDEFIGLTKKLEEAAIPYYAPLLTGFGIGDFHLLEVVEPTDWIRDAVFAYDLLSKIAEKVDVIGHSNGGSIAVRLAAYRPINQLILSGPALFPVKNDGKVKFSVETPVINDIIAYVYPIAMKPQRANRVTNVDIRDPVAAMKEFSYKGVPLMSVRALYDIQTENQEEFISKLNVNETYLIYGADDQSVNIKDIIEVFSQNKIPFQSISYPNSGHNIFSDYDKEEVINDVMKIITQ